VLATAPELLLATGDGAIALLSVQPAGKKPMSAADWLRGGGRGVSVGSRLGAQRT
jgi:methionyl-tRNA formyltransferase